MCKPCAGRVRRYAQKLLDGQSFLPPHVIRCESCLVAAAWLLVLPPAVATCLWACLVTPVHREAATAWTKMVDTICTHRTTLAQAAKALTDAKQQMCAIPRTWDGAVDWLWANVHSMAETRSHVRKIHKLLKLAEVCHANAFCPIEFDHT